MMQIASSSATASQANKYETSVHSKASSKATPQTFGWNREQRSRPKYTQVLKENRVATRPTSARPSGGQNCENQYQSKTSTTTGGSQVPFTQAQMQQLTSLPSKSQNLQGKASTRYDKQATESEMDSQLHSEDRRARREQEGSTLTLTEINADGESYAKLPRDKGQNEMQGVKKGIEKVRQSTALIGTASHERGWSCSLQEDEHYKSAQPAPAEIRGPDCMTFQEQLQETGVQSQLSYNSGHSGLNKFYHERRNLYGSDGTTLQQNHQVDVHQKENANPAANSQFEKQQMKNTQKCQKRTSPGKQTNQKEEPQKNGGTRNNQLPTIGDGQTQSEEPVPQILKYLRHVQDFESVPSVDSSPSKNMPSNVQNVEEDDKREGTSSPVFPKVKALGGDETSQSKSIYVDDEDEDEPETSNKKDMNFENLDTSENLTRDEITLENLENKYNNHLCLRSAEKDNTTCRSKDSTLERQYIQAYGEWPNAQHRSIYQHEIIDDGSNGVQLNEQVHEGLEQANDTVVRNGQCIWGDSSQQQQQYIPLPIQNQDQMNDELQQVSNVHHRCRNQTAQFVTDDNCGINTMYANEEYPGPAQSAANYHNMDIRDVQEIEGIDGNHGEADNQPIGDHLQHLLYYNQPSFTEQNNGGQYQNQVFHGQGAQSMPTHVVRRQNDELGGHFLVGDQQEQQTNGVVRIFESRTAYLSSKDNEDEVQNFQQYKEEQQYDRPKFQFTQGTFNNGTQHQSQSNAQSQRSYGSRGVHEHGHKSYRSRDSKGESLGTGRHLSVLNPLSYLIKDNNSHIQRKLANAPQPVLQEKYNNTIKQNGMKTNRSKSKLNTNMNVPQLDARRNTVATMPRSSTLKKQGQTMKNTSRDGHLKARKDKSQKSLATTTQGGTQASSNTLYQNSQRTQSSQTLINTLNNRNSSKQSFGPITNENTHNVLVRRKSETLKPGCSKKTKPRSTSRKETSGPRIYEDNRYRNPYILKNETVKIADSQFMPAQPQQHEAADEGENMMQPYHFENQQNLNSIEQYQQNTMGYQVYQHAQDDRGTIDYINNSAMTLADLENVDCIQPSGNLLVMQSKQQARTEQRRRKDYKEAQTVATDSNLNSSSKIRPPSRGGTRAHNSALAVRNIKGMQKTLQSNYQKMTEQLEQTELALKEQSLHHCNQSLMKIAPVLDHEALEEEMQPDIYHQEHWPGENELEEHQLEVNMHAAGPEPLPPRQPEQHPSYLPLSDPESYFLSPQGPLGHPKIDFRPPTAQQVRPESQQSLNHSKSAQKAPYASMGREGKKKASKLRNRSTSRQRGQRSRQTLQSSASAGNLNKGRNLAATMMLNAQSAGLFSRSRQLLSQSMTRNGTSSKHNFQAANGATSPYNSTLDPMKKSIIHNHMSHKSKLTSIQQHLASYKLGSKVHLTKHIASQRTLLVQTRKKTSQIKNECGVIVDAAAELKQAYQKKQPKVNELQNKKQSLKNTMAETERDMEEIAALRQGLRHELGAEIRLKESIQQIASKYKKLIAEIRREKEKLAQQVVHQRRISQNLQKRRETLVEDNNKIFDDFSRFVDVDAQNQQLVSKNSQVTLSKEDQVVIDC